MRYYTVGSLLLSYSTVSESWYRQAKDMNRYCSSDCVLVLSVPCILTVLGIAIVIEHVSCQLQRWQDNKLSAFCFALKESSGVVS